MREIHVVFANTFLPTLEIILTLPIPALHLLSHHCQVLSVQFDLFCLSHPHQLSKKLLIGFNGGGLFLAFASHFEFFEQLPLPVFSEVVCCLKITLDCMACDFSDLLLASEAVFLIVEYLAEGSYLAKLQKNWYLVIGG